MNSRNYWFLADSELQWARFHFTSGQYAKFRRRYKQMWWYVWLTIRAFSQERYDALRKLRKRI